jgi:hypothetical protein
VKSTKTRMEDGMFWTCTQGDVDVTLTALLEVAVLCVTVRVGKTEIRLGIWISSGYAPSLIIEALTKHQGKRESDPADPEHLSRYLVWRARYYTVRGTHHDS